MKRVVYLRIDVDFNIGLKKGVPYLLNLLKEKGIQGSFFVVMGPDTLARHLPRAKSKLYQKRLSSYNPIKILRYFGLALIKSRFSGLRVGPDYPEILNRIIKENHDLGVHGFNHAKWADRCYELNSEETKKQMNLAIKTFHELFPGMDWVWAAPNWACNRYMFDYLEEKKPRYSSDLRGCEPFYPLINGKKNSVIQFPINLPCLHELVQFGVPRKKIPSLMVRCLRKNYNLLCIHDYFEGILDKGLFQEVLSAISYEGWEIKPLSQAFKDWENRHSPGDEISTIMLPGGIKKVSCQKQFLVNNYFSQL